MPTEKSRRHSRTQGDSPVQPSNGKPENAFELATRNFEAACDLLELRQQRKTNMRTAANMLAIQRVVEVTTVRGLYP
jgi:hypothetical protein